MHPDTLRPMHIRQFDDASMLSHLVTERKTEWERGGANGSTDGDVHSSVDEKKDCGLEGAAKAEEILVHRGRVSSFGGRERDVLQDEACAASPGAVQSRCSDSRSRLDLSVQSLRSLSGCMNTVLIHGWMLLSW